MPFTAKRFTACPSPREGLHSEALHSNAIHDRPFTARPFTAQEAIYSEALQVKALHSEALHGEALHGEAGGCRWDSPSPTGRSCSKHIGDAPRRNGRPPPRPAQRVKSAAVARAASRSRCAAPTMAGSSRSTSDSSSKAHPELRNRGHHHRRCTQDARSPQWQSGVRARAGGIDSKPQPPSWFSRRQNQRPRSHTAGWPQPQRGGDAGGGSSEGTKSGGTTA
mmetsp:Transcript_39091/g.91462  ORF Transcript_39091/g.91462 Transcript_39091/m.91462 type:complete len:222 (-) Transcript_39091:341-1006(-)